jgi:hypothetical protein
MTKTPYLILFNLILKIMNATAKNPGTKKSTSNVTKLTTELTKKVKTSSNYKQNVIEANKALNVEKNSLGAYLDLLQKYSYILCPEFKAYIKAIKEGDKDKYQSLKEVVRTSKNGKFNQFYTLQGLQKVCFPKK